MSDKSPLLQKIIGEQLSSVEFVQDYIQLHFDGPTLTAFVWPVVSTNGKTTRAGEHGYKDALCASIGRKVQSAQVVEGVEVLVEFEGGARISISLRPEDSAGPEAGYFSAGGVGDPLLEF
jgi:hypothetical protein